MALLVLFSLILIWGFAAWINDDVALLGLFIPVLVLISSILYGSFVWLKTGVWGSIDVLTTYCSVNKQCYDAYSSSSYVGFANLNNWYLGTNVAWTSALVPVFGNMFCTLILDNILALEKVKKFLFTSNSSPSEK